jgi:lipopolysaccharide heptosyltransferase I
MPHPSNILVIRLTSLGDVLLATPAVRSLKRGFPEASISWLAEGSVVSLLKHQDFVDQVIEFPRGTLSRAVKGGKLLSSVSILSSFFTHLREMEYDFVCDFHGIMKSAILTCTARTDRRIGFDRTLAKEGSWLFYGEKVTVPDNRMHKVDRNMLFAQYLGLESIVQCGFTTSVESDQYIDSWLGSIKGESPLFAINPFCSKGSEFKRWDLENYGQLITRIVQEIGATMVILWGPGEQDQAKALQKMAGNLAVLACPTTVSQALSLMKKTDLYVGGDTGLMHMAALSGTPVVAIFGPTDHLVNGPYGTCHIIVRKEQQCSPCRDKECPRKDCIKSITVDDVLNAVITVWERRTYQA